jgi:tetratricopeptide (TPR) repeat protein
VLFITLLFLSLELFHWGQNIFNYDTFFFNAGNQLEPQFSFHEIISVRCFFDASLAFFGLYASFVPIALIKNRENLKYSTMRLYVPDFYLSAYFFPIIIFFIAIFYTAYIVFSSNINESVIKNHAWLFIQLDSFTFCLRILMSTGLFIFFLKNFIWLRDSSGIQDKNFTHNFKWLFIFLCLLIAFNISAKLFDFSRYLYLGYGEFYRLSDKLDQAIHHYNVLVKRNNADDFVHQRLSVLYQRSGNQALAVKHLAIYIVKKMVATGNDHVEIELRYFNTEGALVEKQKIRIWKDEKIERIYFNLLSLYQYLDHFDTVNKCKLTQFICDSLNTDNTRMEIDLFIRSA